MKIFELLDERKNFPLGVKKHEFDYFDMKIQNNPEKIFLVLPQSFLSEYKAVERRKNLLEQYNITGIFSVGQLRYPYAGVNFVLISGQKKSSQHTFISNYFGSTYEKTRDFNKSGLIGEQTITKEYKKYLLTIDNFFEYGNTQLSGFWKVDKSDLDYQNLSIEFYNPSHREKLLKLKQEKYLLLSDIVQILTPRKLDKEGLVIKTKDFNKYPLDLTQVGRDNITSIQLKDGDILISQSMAGNLKMELIIDDPQKPLFASSFLKVLRPKINILPEYLFLYLQSDTAKAYFSMYSAGSIFQNIRIKDLGNMPVPLPDQITQQKSKDIFRIKYLEKENIIEEITKTIIDKKTISKPIQREFITESLESLKIFKKEIIERVLKQDFFELNETRRYKLYKSFLILSGSILEAFLLDRLCEVDQRDYYTIYIPRSEAKNFTLEKMIDKLLGRYQNLLELAHDIRDKRNLVHPRKYFNNDFEVSDKMCQKIIEGLKKIFALRK